MNKNINKRSDQAENESEQPGDLSSFNNRDVERSTEIESAEKTKDISTENDDERQVTKRDISTKTKDDRQEN